MPDLPQRDFSRPSVTRDIRSMREVNSHVVIRFKEIKRLEDATLDDAFLKINHASADTTMKEKIDWIWHNIFNSMQQSIFGCVSLLKSYTNIADMIANAIKNWLLQPKINYYSQLKMLCHILPSNLLQQPIISFSVFIYKHWFKSWLKCATLYSLSFIIIGEYTQ